MVDVNKNPLRGTSGQHVNRVHASGSPGFRWPHLVLAIAVLGSLALVFSRPPFGQDPAYHAFADRRAFFGIPNFWDVVSNVSFLLVGIAGMRFCLRSDLRGGWLALFAGVFLVSFGSAYYHWNPNDATLVWDRLPIAIAFMGLFVALLGEYVDARLARILLGPMLLLGMGSVLYWQWTDDLRLYLWVQLISLLTIPIVRHLFRARNSRSWLLPVALGWYVLAKVAEVYDPGFFAFTRGLFSGHSLKHILVAAGCFTLLWMLRTRKPV